MVRTAECACGRLQITLDGDPTAVVTCHCEFCQRRTGSAFQVGAVFKREQVISIEGSLTTYNGLEKNGVGTSVGDDVSYNFCPTCGSTLFWTFKNRPVTVVAVGNFADPDFPQPIAELHAPQRYAWVHAVEGAEQFETFRPT
jgi:hypothetical protein